MPLPSGNQATTIPLYAPVRWAFLLRFSANRCAPSHGCVRHHGNSPFFDSLMTVPPALILPQPLQQHRRLAAALVVAFAARFRQVVPRPRDVAALLLEEVER